MRAKICRIQYFPASTPYHTAWLTSHRRTVVWPAAGVVHHRTRHVDIAQVGARAEQKNAPVRADIDLGCRLAITTKHPIRGC